MRITVQPGGFDPAALLGQVTPSSGAAGSVVSFTGLARADQGASTRLFLDAYPGFTEAEIAKAGELAIRRFGLLDLLVYHRIGEVAAAEPIVFVAAVAAHRREAFQGADFMMDYLKTSAPFWKKESGDEGERWIEPTERDRADLARWAQPLED
ncbi:MAG: molybdopterin converting factor, subunit 2 [Caulobacteraceae bacterium]|nr:molybdopterin converting factor, subunit 2 [Caulobacteraceae bacterium]